MDWSKVKNVMIIMFTILNLFLLTNLIGISTRDTVSKDILENTKLILKDRGIKLECEIPGYSGSNARLNSLIFTYNKVKVLEKLLKMQASEVGQVVDGESITSGSRSVIFNSDNSITYKNTNPDEKIDTTSVKAIEKYILNLLDSMGFPTKGFVVDKIERNNAGILVVNFTDRFDGYSVFDNYCKAIVSDKGVEEFNISYKKPIDIRKGEGRIIPANQILIQKYPAGVDTTITEIDFGFKGYSQQTSSKEFYESAVWRISEKGQIRYFRAVNGEEIK